MFAAVVSIVVVVICAGATAVAARAYLTEDSGRHGENMNSYGNILCLYCGKPLDDEEGHMHGGQSNPDDTEQFSSFDRAAYIEAQERMARTDEHIMFLANEEWWAEELRSILIDAAHIQADLNSGRLAFPEWIWSSHEPATASAVQ